MKMNWSNIIKSVKHVSQNRQDREEFVRYIVLAHMNRYKEDIMEDNYNNWEVCYSEEGVRKCIERFKDAGYGCVHVYRLGDKVRSELFSYHYKEVEDVDITKDRD